MRTRTIEASYIEYMALMEKVQIHDLELSPKGHHVFKNTWLCAAVYIWNRMKSMLMVDPNEERNIVAAAIKEEIENAQDSKKFQEFHAICFPDLPKGLLAATWTCSGRAVREIGTPILSLPPSKRRTMLIKGLDFELEKLHALWMVPIGDPRDN